MKRRIRCECPEENVGPNGLPDWYSDAEAKAWYHKPGKCPCRSEIRVYIRDGKRLKLCSACSLVGDVRLIPSRKKTLATRR